MTKIRASNNAKLAKQVKKDTPIQSSIKPNATKGKLSYHSYYSPHISLGSPHNPRPLSFDHLHRFSSPLSSSTISSMSSTIPPPPPFTLFSTHKQHPSSTSISPYLNPAYTKSLNLNHPHHLNTLNPDDTNISNDIMDHNNLVPPHPLPSLRHTVDKSFLTIVARFFAVERSDAAILLGIFAFALSCIVYLYFSMPALPPADAAKLRFPRSLEHVRQISQVMEQYKQENFMFVVSAFAACYIFLQAFAIPGAVFLSVLAGPLFGVIPGILIISTVATTGSCICYMFSKTFARSLVQHYFPNQIAQYRQTLEGQRENLFFYMLFLRIAPVLPNWLITVCSPVLDVPLVIFLAATFFGIMPGNYVMVTTGLTLNSLSSSDQSLSIDLVSSIKMLLFGLVALVPILIKNKLKPQKTSGVDSNTTEHVQLMDKGEGAEIENSNSDSD